MVIKTLPFLMLHLYGLCFFIYTFDSMKILGISAFYHDSAVALVEDGVIIYAAQEERFTRIKHDASFPVNALKSCLTYSGRMLDDLDAIVFYDKPLLKFERLLENLLSFCSEWFPFFFKSYPGLVARENVSQKNLEKRIKKH